MGWEPIKNKKKTVALRWFKMPVLQKLLMGGKVSPEKQSLLWCVKQCSALDTPQTCYRILKRVLILKEQEKNVRGGNLTGTGKPEDL